MLSVCVGQLARCGHLSFLYKTFSDCRDGDNLWEGVADWSGDFEGEVVGRLEVD